MACLRCPASIVRKWPVKYSGHRADEHKTMHAKSTDACSECVVFEKDEGSQEASCKKHKDNFPRAEIVTLSDGIKDIQSARGAHLTEVADGKAGYNAMISKACDAYEKAALAFYSAVVEIKVAIGADKNAAIETYMESAAGFVFKMSSEYQMDTHVPSWYEYPQPGTTCFMSKRTVYVRLQCVSPWETVRESPSTVRVEDVCGTRLWLAPRRQATL